MVLSVLIGCAENNTADLQEPYRVPNFEAKNLQTGKTVKLSDFAGKILVISFWTTGCPATPLQAPSLAQLSRENNDIVVLGVTTADISELADIGPFVKKYDWDFPILLGNYDTIKIFDKEMVYPTTFLVNKDGYVVGKIVNYTDFQSTEIKDVIDNMRNGKLRWYYRYLRRLK